MTKPIMPPPEPDGPIWDRYGNRWDRGDSGLWDQEGSVSGDDTFEWEWWELFSRAPLFTTKPEPLWEPEVGGVVETREQYAAMPEGSVVVKDGTVPTYYKRPDGLWCATWQTDRFADMKMAGTSRAILRVGWSL